MHMELYKALQPTPEQRARMAEVWAEWETRKRQLDGDMHAARTLLATLPINIPLPLEFLTHLNALVATTPPRALLASPSPGRQTHPQPSTHSRDCGCHADPVDPFAGLDTVENDMHGAQMGLRSPHSQSFSVPDGSRQCVVSANCSPFPPKPPNGMEHAAVSATLMHVPHASEIQLLGQHVESTFAAERALRELQQLQAKDRDLYVYTANLQMPGVLLGLEMHYRLWSDFIMSQTMAPDCQELCRIAATQQKRGLLFGTPFA
jgi:hypothetical protein